MYAVFFRDNEQLKGIKLEKQKTLYLTGTALSVFQNYLKELMIPLMIMNL